MDPYRYQLGGTLDPNDLTYVLRKADEELIEILGKSQTCSILTSKQMGKSTVAKRATKELEKNDDNIICLTVDLHAFIDEKNNEEKWYNSFVYNIYSRNPNISQHLRRSLKDVWDSLKTETVALSTKLDKFLKKILELTEKKHLILVIDELDELKDITFNTDSLLNYIRSCHNFYQSNTSNSSQVDRITFCLIGTGRPDDFIKDKYKRSFNVGEKIELRGLEFNQDAIDKLSPGLVKRFKHQTLATSILQEIFNWTNGQPFLTQLLCALMCDVTPPDPESENDVERFVKDCIDKNIQTYPEYRDHYIFIKKRIENTKAKPIRLLERYKEILEKGEVPADPNYNYEEMELRLSGLVIPTEDGEHLKPFNRIYEKIFGLDWVNKKLENERNLRPYAEQFNAWGKAKEEIKERYLLSGIELENAQIWQKENPIKLGNDDISFLNNSQMFCQRVEDCFPKTENNQAIITAIFLYTGGVKTLNKIVLQRANKFSKEITEGEEKDWFDKKFIPSLIKDKDLHNHIQEISDRILNDPNINPFLLLSSYQAILEKEEVEFNDSPEHQKLIDMCLGVKEDGKLRIVGKIYRLIFDKKWVEEQLSRLCPYAKEFQSWQSSGCQDESILLKGEDLQKALDWIQNKDKLSESELEFIITSLVWEIWQLNSLQEKTEAVIIVQNNLQSLRKKLNYSYCLLQEVIIFTQDKSCLLENILKLVCNTEADLPVTNESQWLEQLFNSYFQELNIEKINNLMNIFLNQHDNINGVLLLSINPQIVLPLISLCNNQSLNYMVMIGNEYITNFEKGFREKTAFLAKQINISTEDENILFWRLSPNFLLCLVGNKKFSLIKASNFLQLELSSNA